MMRCKRYVAESADKSTRPDGTSTSLPDAVAAAADSSTLGSAGVSPLRNMARHAMACHIQP